MITHANNSVNRAKSSADFVTISGSVVNLVSPDPDTIRISDIAHALSMLCRAAGHVEEHYSIAEHSVRVAERLLPQGDRLALLGLLHDAAEAFTGDIPTPAKFLLGDAGRKAIERIDWAIRSKAGLRGLLHQEREAVGRADREEFEAETMGAYPEPLSPEDARQAFLTMYAHLTARLLAAETEEEAPDQSGTTYAKIVDPRALVGARVTPEEFAWAGW